MHILLVGAWPELANCLVGLPARVTLFQPPAAALPREADWVERLVPVDYTRTGTAVDHALEVHRTDPVDVVVGFRELALPAVAAIAARLGRPAVPGPAAGLGGDKAAVRGQLADGGCRTVRHRLCAAPADLEEFAEQVGYPLIVKPASGAGSAGVHAVLGPADLAEAWARAGAAGAGAPLAEELLTGREFSVEVRSLDGRHETVTITEKLTTGAPHFVETGHLVPARLAGADWAAVRSEAERALDAVGHRTGPSHVEVMLTADGPAVIEINRRLGGDRIWELVQLATGRDLMREALLDAVGLPARPIADSGESAESAEPVGSVGCSDDPAAGWAPRAAAIRFVHAPYETTVTEWRPTALGADIDELVRLRLDLPAPGTRVGPMTSSHDRLGHLITVAATPELAAAAADMTLKHVLHEVLAVDAR